MNKILIVEDEEPISNLIKINLQDAGYRCQIANDGLEATKKIDSSSYDLILLDIMLPEIDGYTLLEYIKQFSIPVIFITAKSTTMDKVMGLKLGAEDYITKPFEIIELLARVETVLRRYNKLSKDIHIFDISIDTLSHVVKKNGEVISLTVKEYDLLLLLIHNKNIALYRDFIYEKVWGEEYLLDSRTVDLHIQRIRKKLGLEKQIVSVYKVGYRLEV